jgi:hypothetical protein
MAIARRRGRRHAWAEFKDKELLKLRFCDLKLTIEGSPIEARIDALYQQLERKGLRFRPHVWLSTEWFSPLDIPGIAIPFYMTHPRLTRLERKMMLEVEGGTRESSMQILRHEAGHAIDTAYRLRRRKRYRELFGRLSVPYPDVYSPRPYSRRFVQHLEGWYAQAHPVEDFAETFAVWLTPGSSWRQRYERWPAMKKLRFVDEVMAEINGVRPVVRSRERVQSLTTMRTTLGEHYAERQDYYAAEALPALDQLLRKLFSDEPRYRKNPTAASFLSRVRPEVRRMVARWTGEYQYTLDQVLKGMVLRSRALGLRLATSERRARQEAPVMVAVQTISYLHTGRHRFSL